MTNSLAGQESLFARDTWCGKTSPEHSAATKDETSRLCSRKRSASSNRKPPVLKCLQKAGLPGAGIGTWTDDGAWLGEYTMRNTGECPSVVVESRLSQILEATPHTILFERKSVSGDLEPRGAAGEEAAEGFGTGADCAIPINDKATRYAGGGSSRNHDGSGNGLGIGKDGDPSPTITAGDRHIVCAAFKAGQGAKANGIGYAEECAPTLGAVSSGTNQCPSVLIFNRAQITSPTNRSTVGPDKPCPTLHAFGEVPAVFYQMQGFGDYREADVASSCKQRDYKDSTDLVIGIDGECNAYIEQYGTLRAHASGGAEETLMHRMVVRRLTPLECERLQGFPDGWTDIGDYTDSTGKKRKTSDSARYKALGNSIALPFWRWMFGRMAAYLPEGATLGSLFDGIGGFPLCWEDVHGAGTAVWASEIEEFPIAVTKKRFGSENMIHYTLNIEPPVEPPAYTCPICPVCGAETDTVYKNVYGDPVGCPECVTEVDAWAE